MNCIYKDCKEKAVMYLKVTRDETAPLGDGISILQIYASDEKTPYCVYHIAEMYEKFRNFMFIQYESIEK